MPALSEADLEALLADDAAAEDLEPVELAAPRVPSAASNGPQPLLAADEADSNLYVTEPLDLHNVQPGTSLNFPVLLRNSRS